jgi:hypothetical protein
MQSIAIGGAVTGVVIDDGGLRAHALGASAAAATRGANAARWH